MRHKTKGVFWVVAALLVMVGFAYVDGAESMAGAEATQAIRGDVRTGPRNTRLDVVVATIDSILWRYQWVQPQITGGGADPDTYEIEWYEGEVPVEGIEPVRVVNVVGTNREVLLWTDYTCPDELFVHVRARGHGTWQEGNVTPWSQVSSFSVQQDCPLPLMPPPPEGTLDTLRTDTTVIELQGAAWFPERDPPELEWSPWQTWIVTDTATGEVVEREVLHHCWYAVEDPEGAAEIQAKWPGICPDSGVITAEALPVLPDSLMEVRCRGTLAEGDTSAWTGWERGDVFDLNCGGALRYHAGGG